MKVISVNWMRNMSGWSVNWMRKCMAFNSIHSLNAEIKEVTNSESQLFRTPSFPFHSGKRTNKISKNNRTGQE